MRRRALLIGFLIGIGSIGAGVAASRRAGDALPEQACVLPSAPVACLDDSSCTPYAAVCDTQGQCVCVASDLGTDLGGGDLGGGDLAPPAGSDGGGSSGTPTTGGGMTSPPKSAGCSFVPGSR